MIGEPVTLTYDVPDEQRLTYKISPLPGALFTMESIGRQMVLLSKILSWADEDSPRCKALIDAIFTEADGSVTIKVIVAPKHPPQNRQGDPA